MLRQVFSLRALSAALFVSTALVAPARSQTVTVPAGNLPGPVSYGAVDSFSSAADVTSSGSGFVFSGNVGEAVNTGTVDAANRAFDFGGTLGSFTNAGTLTSANRGIYTQGATGSIVNQGTINAGTGVIAIDTVETFRNEGTIDASTTGLHFRARVESFNNIGSIASDQLGIHFEGGVGSVENAGTITADHAMTFSGSGSAGSLFNSGSILGTSWGIMFSNVSIVDFTNAGTIRATGGTALTFGGGVTSFTNRANGLIEGGSNVGDFGLYLLSDSGSVVNAGTIRGRGGIYAYSGIDTLTNTGLIEGTGWDAIEMQASVGDFTNGTGGVIRSTRNGVYIAGDADSFTNAGTIESGNHGLWVGGELGAFINSGSLTGSLGVDVNGEVGSVTNSGTIVGTSSYGMNLRDHVGSFSNTGTIRADNNYGVWMGSAGTISNVGTITSRRDAIYVTGNAGSVVNTGTLYSSHGDGISVIGTTGSFFNSGTIIGLDPGGKNVDLDGGVSGTFENRGMISGAYRAVDIDASVGTFINTGTIRSVTDYAIDAESNPFASFTNSGIIESLEFSAVQMGVVGAFSNSGTIRGAMTAVTIDGAGSFENTGTISGSIGLSMISNAGITIVNSGTIEGTDGTAIALGVWGSGHDDVLELRTGSRILGSVEFAGGNDRLDVAGFQGNALLTVAGLENVTAGARLVNAQLDGSGNGTVSIIDGTGITSGGTTPLGEIAGAIGGEIAGALGGIGGGSAGPDPLGYAPARPQGAAEAATDELAASTSPAGPEVWGKVFGGVVGKTSEYGATLGGIVAGSHVAVDASTRLGGVVSVSDARFATTGNGQVVTSTIGSLGLYGSTDLGGVTVNYSVLGGVAANHSDRTVTALTTETARADFTSWYWSPELGVSIPVPLLDGVDTDAGFKLRYIGGGVGGYTESGSSQNLTVGASALNLLDARAELTASLALASTGYGDVTLAATGGVMAQHNFGTSVAIAGFPLATTAAGTALGVYGDVTLQAPIGATAKASASAGVELRTDAVSSASANMGLSATF